MSRPIQTTIFTQNLSHNLAQVKKLTKARPTWAVVKANAYGHGLQAAYAGFAQSEGLALLDLHDAQLLREMGWKTASNRSRMGIRRSGRKSRRALHLGQ